MTWGNCNFKGPWRFIVPDPPHRPYVYLILDRRDSLYTVLDVGEHRESLPLRLHPMETIWRCMCNGELCYEVFPMPLGVFSSEERQTLVADLVIIYRPVCLYWRLNNLN
jgi:hypothetical protein